MRAEAVGEGNTTNKKPARSRGTSKPVRCSPYVTAVRWYVQGELKKGKEKCGVYRPKETRDAQKTLLLLGMLLDAGG